MTRAAAAYASQQVPRDEGQLVQRYSRLIDRSARRIASRSGGAVQADDLWSAGAMGLLEAGRRFDETKAASFETYADHRIRGAMLDELRKLDHLPRRLRARADSVRKAKAELGHRLGREPDVLEVAAFTGLEVEEVQHAESVSQVHLPMDADAPLASAEASIEDRIEHRQKLEAMTKAVEQLTPRLALVVSLYYYEGLTYRQIGEALEVTEARVCQLHGEAMKKVRAMLSGSEA